MKTTMLAIFITAITGFSTPDDPSPIGKAGWLLGTWENTTQRGVIYEEWMQTGDSEFSARSYALAGSDTLVMETIRLVADGGDLLYIPTVRNQNEGQPVEFRSIRIDDDEMVFTNLDHDFPQFISYTRTGPDSLVAAIYGTVNGRERRVTFPMRRIN